MYLNSLLTNLKSNHIYRLTDRSYPNEYEYERCPHIVDYLTNLPFSHIQTYLFVKSEENVFIK